MTKLFDDHPEKDRVGVRVIEAGAGLEEEGQIADADGEEALRGEDRLGFQRSRCR